MTVSAKKVVEPEEAMQIVEPVSPAPPLPKATPAVSVPKTSWQFVNNVIPDLRLRLEDSTIIEFKEAVFTTGDAELAKKIKMVAQQHHICEA